MAPQTFEHKKTEAPTPLEKEKTEKPEESKETQEDLLDEAEKKVQEFKDSGLDVAEKMATAQEEKIDEDIKEELEGQNQEAEGALDELEKDTTAEKEEMTKEEKEIQKLFKNDPHRLLDDPKYLKELTQDQIDEVINACMDEKPGYVAAAFAKNRINLSKDQKAELFESLKKIGFSTRHILEHFNPEEYELPQKKLDELINDAIQNFPYMLLGNEKIKLSKEQKEELIEVCFQKSPDSIIRKIDKLELSEEQTNRIIDIVLKGTNFSILVLTAYVENKINLSNEQMNRLVDSYVGSYCPDEFIKNFKKFTFTTEQQNKFVHILISKKDASRLTDCIDTFKDLEYKEIADQLLAAGVPIKKLVSVPEISQHLTWGESLTKLRKIQNFSVREEHCPWTNELQPLLQKMTGETLLSPDNAEDGELFVSFVKEFGAFNTPVLMRSYLELKRMKDLSEITPETKKILTEALGAGTLEKSSNPEAVINEIRKFKKDLQKKLLQDKIPDKINTELGTEILNALKGTTKWEDWRGESLPNTINTWQKTAKENPQLAELPRGYKEKRIEISETEIIELSGEERTQKEKKLLDNKTLQQMFQNLRDAMKEGSKIENINEYWENQKEKLLKTISKKSEKTRERLNKVPEKAKKGMQKSIEKMESTIKKIEGLEIKKDASEKEVVELMDNLSTIKEAKSILHEISAAHMRQIIPEGWKTYLDSLAKSEGKATKQEISDMSELLLQFINEHYLHPEQKNHRTYHSPFSKNLRKALEEVWQTREDPRKHLLHKTNNELRQISEKGTITKKKTEIAFVPTKGLLRIFSGDVGDACYTSQHDELAKGEYPDMISINFVTNRGKAHERIEGSILFVETQTPNGKKVLNIRANNPRENLLGKVDNEALVKETIKYAKEIAKRRGLDMVTLPLDAASESSSNRPKVSEYYENNFSKNDKVELVNEPETNFNGYTNWDSKGAYPVVAI